MPPLSGLISGAMNVTIDADPGSTFTASLALSPAQTGLVGILAVSVIDAGQQNYAVARTTAGISEFPAGSGIYGADLVAPLAPGLYIVMFDTAGSGAYTPTNSWTEPLTITIEDPVFPGGWTWTPYGWLNDSADGEDDAGVDISTGSPGSNAVPDATYVAAASKLDFADLGFLATDMGPGGLQELVDRAESSYFRITGQTLSQIDAQDAPLVRRVIQGLTEQMAMAGTADTLDTMQDWDLILSFNAGNYSETRRSADDMYKARMLNPIPWISDALWSMLEPDRYDHYISFFTGTNPPAWQGNDVFWEDGQVLGRLAAPDPGFYWGA